MKIKKEIRRKRKLNISEISKPVKENQITTFGTGLAGYCLHRPEIQG